jgi:imidazolonepropionase-like amidohydrolase
MGAIEAGTGVGARVLGFEKELGTVEEGKLADLIMVTGNPLDNIDILLDRESIRMVMQGGRIVKGDFFEPIKQGGKQ